jgi:hypothetical protein
MVACHICPTHWSAVHHWSSGLLYGPSDHQERSMWLQCVVICWEKYFLIQPYCWTHRSSKDTLCFHFYHYSVDSHIFISKPWLFPPKFWIQVIHYHVRNEFIFCLLMKIFIREKRRESTSLHEAHNAKFPSFFLQVATPSTNKTYIFIPYDLILYQKHRYYVKGTRHVHNIFSYLFFQPPRYEEFSSNNFKIL